MNRPRSNDSRHGRAVNAFEYYFDIENNRPIVTPLVFWNTEKSGCIKYDENFRGRNRRNYVNLLNNFKTGDLTLEQFKIKDKKFLCGKGCIFRFEIGEDTVYKLYPICIVGFDENTNFDTKTGYKIVINTQELENKHNKQLRTKLQKFINLYVTEHKSDVIYTSNLFNWCFNQAPKLKFSSIKQQKEYLENLILQTN